MSTPLTNGQRKKLLRRQRGFQRLKQLREAELARRQSSIAFWSAEELKWRDLLASARMLELRKTGEK